MQVRINKAKKIDVDREFTIFAMPGTLPTDYTSKFFLRLLICINYLPQRILLGNMSRPWNVKKPARDPHF